MIGGALKRQAFSHFAEREAEEEDGHYVPDPRQVELFHDGSLQSAGHHGTMGAESGGESFGKDSVSAAPNLRSEGARIDRDQQDRNLRSVLDQVFPIDEIGTHDFTELVGTVLYDAFGHLSAPIKRIAQVANVNERTAKNWWEKKCAPGPIHTLRLMAHVPQFQGRMRQLTAMEADLDPDLARSMAETIRLMQMRGLR